MTVPRPPFSLLLAASLSLGLCSLTGAQDGRPTELEQDHPERPTQGQEENGARRSSVLSRLPGASLAPRLIPAGVRILGDRALQRIGPVVQREREFFRSLSQWMSGDPQLFEGFGVADSPRASEQRIRGVRGQSGDTEILRLRFRTPQEAETYALNRSDTLRYPTMVEVRGNQVVQIHSPKLLDPGYAARLREGAWRGLPHAGGAPTVAATYLSADEFFVEGRTSHPEFRAALDEAIRAIHQNTMTPSPTEGEIRTDRLAAGFDRSGDSATVWYSGDPDNAERIAAHAARFQAESRALANRERKKPQALGKPKPKPLTRGARKPLTSARTKPKPQGSRGPRASGTNPKPVQEGAGSVFERLVTKPLGK